MLDGTGWRDPRALAVPANVSLITLPPHAPEPNPVERIWLYLRETRLSLRLFYDYGAIVEACCIAWRKLTPEHLHSLTASPYLEGING